MRRQMSLLMDREIVGSRETAATARKVAHKRLLSSMGEDVALKVLMALERSATAIEFTSEDF
jgi:hypothetical protein